MFLSPNFYFKQNKHFKLFPMICETLFDLYVSSNDCYQQINPKGIDFREIVSYFPLLFMFSQQVFKSKF